MTENSAPLVRRGRRNACYTAISNFLIDHPSLSPDARIALIYLLSKPDDWQLQINDLRRVLGTGVKACGRDKAYKVVKELKDTAYVVAVEELRGGRFYAVTYYVFDEPMDDPEAFRAEVRRGFAKMPPRNSEVRNEQVPAPYPEKPDTVSSPSPSFQDTEKQQLTKDGKKQITKIPPPSPRRKGDRTASRAEAGGERFAKLWEIWPVDERPRNRAYAQRVFDNLNPDDQLHAYELASQYRSVQKLRATFAAMIPYLRDRLFLELLDGPPFTPDGYLRITPDRPEWSAWMSYIEAVHGAKGRARQETLGFLLSKTRWPERPSVPISDLILRPFRTPNRADFSPNLNQPIGAGRRRSQGLVCAPSDT